MKRILIICGDNLGIGGIQNVVINIFRSLKEDYRFDAIVFDHNYSEYENEFKEHGCIFTVKRYEGNCKFRKRLDFYIRPMNVYLNIRRIIKENGPYDVIHCHNAFEGGLALKAAKKCGIEKRIMHSHGYAMPLKGHFIRKIYENIYKKMISKYANSLVACSKLASDYLFGNCADAKIILNAVDLKKFSFSAIPAKNIYSFINVGRYGPIKNQLFLIDVLYYIHKTNKEATLSLVGYGDNKYIESLKNRAVMLGVEKSVFFFPGNSNIYELLRENNIYLSASVTEGLGISLIEAQSVGLKCFCSTGVPVEANCGSMEYISLDEGPEKWAKIINEYIKQNGSKRIKCDMENFDIKNIMKKYKALYE